MQPTNCLWIGGLNERTRQRDLEREFKYFLNHDSHRLDTIWLADTKGCAYVLFPQIKHAEQVRYDLRGKTIYNSERLRIDFVDAKQFNSLKSTVAAAVNTDSQQSATDKSTDSSVRSRSTSKSPSRTSTSTTRRVIALDEPISETESKSKKAKLADVPPAATNGSFENIIITKTDNGTRRVDTINSLPVAAASVAPVANAPVQAVPAAVTQPEPTPTVVNTDQSVVEKAESKSESIQNEPAQTNGNVNGNVTRTAQADDEPAKDEDVQQPIVDVKPSKRAKQPAKQTTPSHDDGEIVDWSELAKKQPASFELKFNPTHVNTALAVNSSAVLTITDIGRQCEPVWSGLFTLKKNSFPTKFYLLVGNATFARQTLPPVPDATSSAYNNLHINQRIRLDSSKLDDIEKKLVDFQSDSSQPPLPAYSILLALPSDLKKQTSTPTSLPPVVAHQQRSLFNLITYLDQKSAAGVVSLPDDAKPTANLNIFTPGSAFSHKLIEKLLPSNIPPAANDESADFLVIVLLKNNLHLNNADAAPNNKNV